MFLFWAVAANHAGPGAGLILMRAAGASAQAGAADPAPALYRRQLSEIDDLAERGLMGEAERAAAHAEAGRRLLAATDAPPEPWGADPRARGVVLLAVIAGPALALGLYLKLGAPGIADQPYAVRLAHWKSSDLNTLSAPEIAAVLRDATAKRPEAEGFRLLGLAENAAGNPIASVRALRRAAAMAPSRPDIWLMLGQAEVAEAGGKVDEDAQRAFNRLLALVPGDPTARFFLANAKADAGDRPRAIADLTALMAEFPAGDERRAQIQASIARLQGKPVVAANPQQQAMIQGMVAGLAARLQAKPDDPQGWVRLVRAYAVLGDTAKRDAAYATARARYERSPQVLQQLDEAARAEMTP
jgi:cytochrome c-type biogenesis protein CcmH